MMMTEDKSIFLDTNILVYANVAETPLHLRALDTLQRIKISFTDIWISRQILREYISSVTKDSPLIKNIPVSLIADQINFFENNFRIADESELVTHNLLSVIKNFPTKGRKIHDANIVATMISYNIPTIVTENKKDFDRYSSLIEVLTIEDILSK
jgi:predicted nucleic acid-binding protein